MKYAIQFIILLFFIATAFMLHKLIMFCAPKQPTTKIKIYNPTTDTVTVYLTLGATPGCLQKVNLVPWVTDTVLGQKNMQGTFVLYPNDSTEAYAPDTLGFNGVISFNTPPNNCASPVQFPTGVNQFEFQLNNLFQGPKAQESINISCVHGVNCVILVNTNVIKPFNAGPYIPEIQSFKNNLDRNSLLPGVYPYGCDTCTGTKTKISCISYPQPAQKSNVCQVQRPAVNSGGLIKVIYLSNLEPLK